MRTSLHLINAVFASFNAKTVEVWCALGGELRTDSKARCIVSWILFNELCWHFLLTGIGEGVATWCRRDEFAATGNTEVATVEDVAAALSVHSFVHSTIPKNFIKINY